MNAPRLTDAQVSQALRAHLPDRAQAGLRERILEAAETTAQQRALPSFLGALSEADPVTRRRSLLIAAALLVALALASAVAVGALRLFDRDPIQQLSLEPPTDIQATPLPTPTPKATARPSLTVPVGPLAWTPASLKEDWPAPVRPEPAGAPIVVPLRENADEVIPDPLGDTESAAHPWVDIQELQGGGARIIIELGGLTPHVAPIEQWIAYGVVVDDDRDGIADRRFGIDNVPGTAPGNGGHRAWMTDLHTGRTLVVIVAILDVGDENLFDTFFPSSTPGRTGAWLQFGGQCPGRPRCHPGLVDPFYVWASVIVNGRVVATDYAPDVGWLLEAKP